jgi:predicted metal-dependent phosphoesterase TrpH/glycosyltransferase involved in cell wall biosynthesis
VDCRDESLRVALVTPFQWLVPGAVNQHVADLARGLLARGHRPVVLASSNDLRELDRMRLLCRRRRQLAVELLQQWVPGTAPDARLLPPESSGPLDETDGVPVVPLGRSFPIRLNGSVASIGLPVDVTSRLEAVLMGGGFHLVHVHEPIAPSLAFTSLRESRSPVVATFHLTPAGLLAYELGQTILALFYERLDGRVVTAPRAAEILSEFFGGTYQTIPAGTGVRPAADVPRSQADALAAVPPRPVRPGSTPTCLYTYRGDDRRGLRAFLRALAAAPRDALPRVVVALHRPSAERWLPHAVPRALRARVETVLFDSPEELAALHARASFVVLPFLGGEWLLTAAAEALVCGRPFLAPGFPVMEDLVREVGQGTLFSPETDAGIAGVLAAACGGAGAEAPASQDAVRAYTSDAVVEGVLDLYREAMAATKEAGPRALRPPQRVSRRAQRLLGAEAQRDRGWLYADLHIHTAYSGDSSSSVDAVLAAAREVGLGAIAIADHNQIAGAFAAQESNAGQDDLIVIAAEEVKTSEGEVIGMFLEELIPRGLTFNETLSLIKEQGGLVYVPHPFDRMRTTPPYRLMVENVHRIDVIEIYNARNYLSSFNVEAERFASKYKLAAGAGSDAHVLQGIGRAMLRMPRFTGRHDFLESLRGADILTRRKGLVYLQSLKLLQNTLDRVLPGVEARNS